MKLVQFALTEGGKPLLGVLTPLGILEASTCCRLHALSRDAQTPDTPESILELLRAPRGTMDALRQATEWALSHSRERTVLFHSLKVCLLPPIGRPPKIICVGQNYYDHCKEQGKEPPKQPVVFAKYPTAVLAPEGRIVKPKITQQLDYEAELAFVIGKGGRHIPREKALDHIAGYMNFNDVSARDLQFGDGQWTRGKSCDTFAPMGPALVTADEVPDPGKLRVQCRLNGETMQDSNTSQLIFPVDYLVAFISQFMTLETGDVVATGTPPGVGVWRKPQVLMKSGDVVEIEVEGLGVLRNTVIDEA
jgi:acylpyruvate hydrolase